MRHLPPLLAPHPSGLTALREIAEAPPAGSTEELALTMLERLTGLSDQLRQTLSDKLWAEIPAIVQEGNWAASIPAGGQLLVNASLNTLVKITTVIVSVPAGASGTLQLGDTVIPNLPPGVTSLPMAQLLQGSDTRALTIGTAAGPAALYLQGTQLAPEGSLSL